MIVFSILFLFENLLIISITCVKISCTATSLNPEWTSLLLQQGTIFVPLTLLRDQNSDEPIWWWGKCSWKPLCVCVWCFHWYCNHLSTVTWSMQYMASSEYRVQGLKASVRKWRTCVCEVGICRCQLGNVFMYDNPFWIWTHF